MKKYILTIILIFALGLSMKFAFVVFGQSATSNCIVTKVGEPIGEPQIPPECQSGVIEGIETPPNLECRSDGYCKMPPSTDGSYQLYSCEKRRWGSNELVSVLHTVAKNWKANNPEGYLMIGDLNAAGHASHNIGIANDLYAYTKPGECVANYDDNDDNFDCGSRNYNREKTIELGKLFVDTGVVLNIWYNDPAVNSVVMDYARITGKSPKLFNSPKNSPTRPGMRDQPGHANHFHLDVDINQSLDYWEPSC